jgi:D-2-hydroxyglutarate dehydrogenase
VLGLEIVLADGRVLDLLKTLRKDNTGYDLKQLFIGAEGTLGIITKVALVAPPLPVATGVLFAGCGSFKNAVAAMRAAKKVLGGSLSAFEFLDRASLEVVLRELKGTSDPLPLHKSPFYLVCEVAETGGEEASAARKKARRRLETFAAFLSRRGLVTASLVGKNEKQAFALWNLRERVSLALKHAGATYKYDLSLPTESMYDLVDALRARVARRVTEGDEFSETNSEKKRRFDFSSVPVMGYGHLGDGNLHLNVSSPTGYHPALLKLIEPFVYEFTANARGSVSAEHGVGAMKPNELSYSKPENAIEIMRGVKTMLDPRGILNPYKVLPASTPPRARL